MCQVWLQLALAVFEPMQNNEVFTDAARGLDVDRHHLVPVPGPAEPTFLERDSELHLSLVADLEQRIVRGVLLSLFVARASSAASWSSNAWIASSGVVQMPCSVVAVEQYFFWLPESAWSQFFLSHVFGGFLDEIVPRTQRL